MANNQTTRTPGAIQPTMDKNPRLTHARYKPPMSRTRGHETPSDLAHMDRKPAAFHQPRHLPTSIATSPPEGGPDKAAIPQAGRRAWGGPSRRCTVSPRTLAYRWRLRTWGCTPTQRRDTHSPSNVVRPYAHRPTVGASLEPSLLAVPSERSLGLRRPMHAPFPS